MTDKWRASSGLEWLDFSAHYCDRCKHDVGNECPIIVAAFVYNEREPEYPSELVCGPNRSSPQCKNFEPVNGEKEEG